MKVIVCVDDKGGVMFNHRRQSQDRILRERILEMTAGRTLWMNSYSAKMFGNLPSIAVAEDFLDRADESDFCFVENISIAGHEYAVKEIILFKWNRSYPHDLDLDIDLTDPTWRLVSREDFPGNSHEKLTMEVYER